MKLLSLILLSILGVACVPMKESAKTTAGGVSNGAAPYLWIDEDFPKTLRVSSDFSPEELSNIEDMAEAWSDSVDNEIIFFTFGASTSEVTHSLSNMDSLYETTPILGIYKSAIWPQSLKTVDIYGNSAARALAVTQIFGRRHNEGRSNEFVAIEHADILINYEVFRFDTADSGPGYDLRTVVLHELGHFLGLQHRELPWYEKDNSVMYPSIGVSEAKRYPRPMDASDLATKYNIHLGGSFGSGYYATSPRQNYRPDPQDPGEEIKILMELHPDGNCVHKESGKTIHSHKVELKNQR